MDHNWSQYQKDIYDFVRDQNDNGIIEAVAGSGKTTTVIESLKYTHAEKSVFLAFNASVAETMRDRGVTNAFTTHKYGLDQIKASLGKYVKVEKNRDKSLLDTLLHSDEDKELIPHVLKTITLSKMKMISVEESALETDATTADLPLVINLSKAVIETALLTPNVVDFSDMIYIPATGIHGVTVDPVDFLAVDEVQDLNPAQIALILKASQNGRIISVGDSRQSIYAFRGADENAMSRVKDATQATQFPLSISYRCPKAVVALAKEIVPEIESSQDAIDGIIRSLAESDLITDIAPYDMILCRTNAPLLRLAFRLFKNRKPFKLNGSDFGDRIIYMYHKAVKETGDNLSLATDWIIADLKAKQEQYKGAEIFDDQIDSIRLIASECKTVKEATGMIKDMFNPYAKGTLLSTVHRAKGMESNRVYILYPELMPHPKAKSESEMLQEMNLKYIALTRAKRELVMVS